MAEMLQGSESAQSGSASERSTTADSGPSRINVFLHSFFFVLGFTTVFTLLGAAAGLFGRNLNAYMPMLQRLGAILLFIFAMATLGVFRWLVRVISERTDLAVNPAAAGLVSVLNFLNNLMYTEKRVTQMHTVNPNWGYVSSFLLGVSFSAGWVPCVGPILGSIWVLASDSTTVAQGALLLAIYSMGMGIPFLITGAAFSTTTKVLRKLNRHAHIVSIISGIFLLYVAFLLWNGSLTTLNNQFNFLAEWVADTEYLLIGSSSFNGNIISASTIAAAPIAFFAGLISFFSPCVLPLIPAYIGYLSSTAVGGGNTTA